MARTDVHTYVSFTPPLPKSITDSSMIPMLPPSKLANILHPVDLTAPKVAAGKKSYHSKTVIENH